MNVQHHLLGLDGTHPWPAGTLRPPPGYPGHTTRRHPTFYNWALRRLREGDGHLQPGPPQPGPAPFALQEQGSCASTSAAAATRPGPTSGPTGGAGGPRPGRLGTTSASGEVPSNSRGPLRAACADAMEEESDWSVSQVRVAVVGETSHLIFGDVYHTSAWPAWACRESSGRGVCPDFPVRGLLPALRRPALPWRPSGQPGPLGSEVGRVRDRRGKARASQLGGAGSRSHNPYRDMRWIPIWRPSRGHSTLSPADPLVTYLKTRPPHSA